MTIEAAAQAYRDYLEALTPDGLSGLDSFVATDVRFADPFNDVRGADCMRRILEDMFAVLSNVVFRVHAMGLDGDRALMAWTLTAMFRGRHVTLEGMSAIRFNAEGRVAEHIDHWDSATQFYMRLPVIGWLLSLVRRRAAASGTQPGPRLRSRSAVRAF